MLWPNSLVNIFSVPLSLHKFHRTITITQKNGPEITAFCICAKQYDFCAISSAECYSVLCPFLTKMSIIYRWNQHQMFYLQSSLDVAYHISMRIYKLFNLASLPKNDFILVLYCSMSILNRWNASIKKGLVTWLLRSHEHILLCHWFSTTIHNYLRMRR